MKLLNPIRLFCVMMGLGVVALPAKDAGDYRVGDVVSQDVVSPIAFEVIDSTATAALKASEAAKVPVVFKAWSEATNLLVAQFNAAFDTARSNFLASLQETFQKTKLDDAAIATPDFGYDITAYNIKYRDFPITTALAQDWAYGRTGYFTRNELVTALLTAGQNHLTPDDLPLGLGLGDVVQIVPVNRPDQKLTLADMHGQIVAKTDLMTVSLARIRFRQVFKGYDEQPLARILAAWLKPNCFPDAQITQKVRDYATRQLVVSEHYAVGQVIAPQGSVIDAKVRAALDELQQKLATSTGSKPGASTGEATSPSAALTALDLPPPATAQLPIAELAVSSQPAPRMDWRHGWPVIALFSISGLSAVFILCVIVWKMASRRHRATARTDVITDLAVQLPSALQTQLAPQLVQAVRDALVHELAGQRHELLVVQQNAAVQVTKLVRRMDAMQMELQERLKVYENQVRRLESELAARTEENQELIKLKIQMIRQQSESEAHPHPEPLGELVGFS